MFSATRKWFRRNRTPLAIGAAVVGGTYLVGGYVLGKINDARERAQLDKIAKDKYVFSLKAQRTYTYHDSAFEDVSSKTKPIAQ